MRVLRPLLCLSLLSACRETARDTVLTPRPASVVTSAGLEVERLAGDDTVFTVVLYLSPRGDLGAVGRITASIEYDTTAMRFVRDASSDDGALRAVHEAGGRVRVAVASSSGVAVDGVARLRFSVRAADRLHTALETLALQVLELHELSARDVPRVALLPVRVTP